MTNPSRSEAPSRLGAAALGALASVAAAVAVVATPGVAAATTTAGPVPLVDCVTVEPDGSYDAVLGYRTSQAADIPYGPDNRIDPPSDHPTTFEPGTQHAVFVLHVEPDSPPPRWALDGNQLVIGPAAAAACSADPPTPSSDGEHGPLLTLVGTGVLGSSLRLLARRREAGRLIRGRCTALRSYLLVHR